MPVYKILYASFLNIPISRGVLRSNELNYYTITEYSNDYYVSLEGDPLKFSYPEIIKKRLQN